MLKICAGSYGDSIFYLAIPLSASVLRWDAGACYFGTEAGGSSNDATPLYHCGGSETFISASARPGRASCRGFISQSNTG